MIPLVPFHRSLPVVVSFLAGTAVADERTDFFESRIRPALATHCFECHGHKAKGGLKLDSPVMALRGGLGTGDRSGNPIPVALSGPLGTTISSCRCPPRTNCRHVISDFRKWIADGAVWADDTTVGFASGTITDFNVPIGRSSRSGRACRQQLRVHGRRIRSMPTFTPPTSSVA